MLPGPASEPASQRGTIELDALPGVNLGLQVAGWVIGILGEQHCLGGIAALDDPRQRRGRHDCTLARTTAVAQTASHQHAEGGGHRVASSSQSLIKPLRVLRYIVIP